MSQSVPVNRVTGSGVGAMPNSSAAQENLKQLSNYIRTQSVLAGGLMLLPLTTAAQLCPIAAVLVASEGFPVPQAAGPLLQGRKSKVCLQSHQGVLCRCWVPHWGTLEAQVTSRPLFVDCR